MAEHTARRRQPSDDYAVGEVSGPAGVSKARDMRNVAHNSKTTRRKSPFPRPSA